MTMKNCTNKTSAFSLVEMLIASVIFVGFSAGVYSFLKSQQSTQLSTIQQQTKKRISSFALERFQNDMMLVDANWIKQGLPVVFPHQGYGFGDNFYLNELLQAEHGGAPDGVTFLRRHTQQDRFFEYAGTHEAFCLGNDLQATQKPIFNSEIMLEDLSDLKVGDWILIFQNDQSVVGIISEVTQKGIGLRNLSTAEAQQVSQGSGFVIQSGVLPSSVDVDGQYGNPNQFCFSSQLATIQKIGNPVSYVLTYATSDGEEKSTSNIYLLGTNGQKKKMLTRIEYQNGQRLREYLAEVDNVEITYDLADASAFGGVVSEVGRGQNSQYMVNIQNPGSQSSVFHYAPNIVSMNMNLVTKTIDPKQADRVLVQNQNMKATFDLFSGQILVAESIEYSTYVTDLLNNTRNIDPNIFEQIGKPYYLVHDDGTAEMLVPTSRFLVDRTLRSENPSEWEQDDGRLLVLDSTGCPANAGNDCLQTAKSYIQFRPQVLFTEELGEGLAYRSKFFPNSVNFYENQTHKTVVIGGMSITELVQYESSKSAQSGQEGQVADKQIERQAGFAVVSFPVGQTLAQYMNQNSLPRNESGNLIAQNATCSVASCQWFNIDEVAIEQSLNNNGTDISGLVDTSNLSITASGNLLMVPMTLKEGEDGVGVYLAQATLSDVSSAVRGGGSTGNPPPLVTVDQPLPQDIDPLNSEPVYRVNIQKLSTIPANSDQLVTAIGERTISVDGVEYLPFCTSKSLPLCDGSGGCQEGANELGEIQLIPLEQLAPVNNREEDVFQVQVVERQAPIATAAYSNYYCTGLSVMGDNSLVVTGRLGVHQLTNSEIKSIIRGDGYAPMLYLDDIALEKDGKAVYADAYLIDDQTFSQDDEVQDIKRLVGWRSGVSSMSFPDGSFGIVSTQNLKMRNRNAIGEITEGFNVAIHLIDMPSSNDRVLVSINTDPTNFNNSQIFSTYVRGAIADGVTPPAFIPGNYIVQSGELGGRTTPTPLPALGPVMSEEDWLTLFQHIQNPQSFEGLNMEMPAIDLESTHVPVSCEEAYTETCSTGGGSSNRERSPYSGIRLH